VKISGPCEFLADDSRAYQLSVSLNELAVCASWKEQLRYTRNRERIDETKDHGRNKSEPNGGKKVLFHKFL
jgi:hypothetical protein